MLCLTFFCLLSFFFLSCQTFACILWFLILCLYGISVCANMSVPVCIYLFYFSLALISFLVPICLFFILVYNHMFFKDSYLFSDGRKQESAWTFIDG